MEKLQGYKERLYNPNSSISLRENSSNVIRDIEEALSDLVHAIAKAWKASP